MTILSRLVFIALFCAASPFFSHAQEKQEEPPKKAGFLLADAGFATPESMLHDPSADWYLVSNINGSPSKKDGKGFISKISPEGKIISLKWIDGTAEKVTLHAPKGMALTGDLLVVTDIDTIRFFDRMTGKRKGEVEVEGAVFLNDVAATAGGTLYVTDNGASAIYTINRKLQVNKIAKGERLMGPNGIQVKGDQIHVAGFSGKAVYRLGLDGNPSHLRELPASGLDGLVILDDGTLLVSSWRASAVFALSPTGKATVVAEGITAPADIGFDEKRKYLLIPHFQDHKVEARPLIEGKPYSSEGQPQSGRGRARDG